MDSRIINNSVTEIYVTSGWITEAYPTNFHNFFKRKLLTANEHIEDYKEITEAEKLSLENADSVYERPPQLFIDQWTQAAQGYGCYNENTGFFELNGLIDITYKEALTIHRKSGKGYLTLYGYARSNVRTLYPISTNAGAYADDYKYAFTHNSQLLVIRFLSAPYYLPATAFTSTYNIEKIYGAILVQSSTVLSNLNKLETAYIYKLSINLDIGSSDKFSLESFSYLIKYANNKSEIQITVHPQVYAKLTDEANEEWHQVLLDAVEKNIQFITT